MTLDYIISAIIGAFVGFFTNFLLGNFIVLARLSQVEAHVRILQQKVNGAVGIVHQKQNKQDEEEAMAQVAGIFLDQSTPQDQKLEKLKGLAMSNPALLKLAKKFLNF